MGLSPQQLERRLKGITATDLAAIVGVHPYRSRIDVWREKRGELPSWEGNEETRWGERMEPVVRAHYAERHGVRLETPGTLAHPDEPWMISTPDAIAYEHANPEPKNGVECKQHGWRMAANYGAPGSDDVPLYELCQCVWNIAVTGLSRWDLVVSISGPPVEYVIERDDELIAGLKEQAERFLVDCVRGGAVPEPDGHEHFDTWLKQRWERNPGELLDIGEDGETFTLIERAKEIRAQGKDLDDEHARIIQTLKLKIGEHQGLTWKDANGRPQKITWKRNKGSRIVNHEGIANDARADARLALSAKNPEIVRALLCLASLGPNDPIGRSSRATMTSDEMRKMIEALNVTLVEISARTDAAYTTEVPGNRPFCFPRNWKAPSGRKEQD